MHETLPELFVLVAQVSEKSTAADTPRYFDPGIMLWGTAKVLALDVLAAVASWIAIRATVGASKLRVLTTTAILFAYQGAILTFLDMEEMRVMAVLFILFWGAYSCRLLSSVFWHRKGGEAPGFWFHVILLVWGARQHYGAGDWSQVRGRGLSWKLMREWALHILYSLALILVYAVLVRLWFRLGLPFKREAYSAAAFLIILEVLEFTANAQAMTWAPFGKFPGFFGRFAVLRARHVGQWWQYWNVPAINLFREVTQLFKLTRSRFLNVMAVFFVSAVIHQVLVMLMIRQLAYGTMLAFMAHGVLVFAFGALWTVRDRMIAPVRWLLFNQITSLVVAVLATMPFILDFSGRFSF